MGYFWPCSAQKSLQRFRAATVQFPVRKKLTQKERLVDELMLAMLEWASKHQKGWHDIGKLPEWRRAAELLEKRGVIETKQPQNQYRLKKPQP